jgi:molybdate transport system substrate-binding protein
MKTTSLLLAVLAAVLGGAASAGEVKVLCAGAMREVVLAVVPAFEQATGHKVTIDSDTAGGLVRRIGGGEAFDVAVITPAALEGLVARGKVKAPIRELARVGIGIAVKAGTPVPDIRTVDAFKQALVAAKSIAFMDPASGASSGIYVAALIDRLGLADELKPKIVLVRDAPVAVYVARGEAEVGLQQISEIMGVAGVMLVGPLPPEIQNVTIYAGAVGANPAYVDAAEALMKFLAGPAGASVIKARGMEPAS